jgi:23S rRNA (cytosine1962-C5)-methyltransferase
MAEMLNIAELMQEIGPKLAHLQDQPDGVRRLLHGRGGRFAGWKHLNIDYYAGIVQLIWFAEHEHPDDNESALLEAMLSAASGCITGVVSQRRYVKPAVNVVIWGAVPDALVVNEQGLRFHVDMQRQNSGLFLDMQPGRQWLQDNAQGCQVLNSFAFTCSLSVAAIAGGADRVVNIDMNGGVLKRGRENQALNGQQQADVEYLPYKVLNSIGKLERKGPFDLVIVDPPTFQRGSFEFHKDYGRLLRRLPRLLGEEATLLLCCNSPSVSQAEFQQLIADNFTAAEFVERIAPSVDFQEQGDDVPLKVLVYRYRQV